MKAIIDSTGALVTIVYDAQGYEVEGGSVVDNVPLPPDDFAWNVATQSFEPRPPTAAEETAAALSADPRWQALKTATPAQVESWLAANVTDMASARRVLKILVLAVQTVARTRN